MFIEEAKRWPWVHIPGSQQNKEFHSLKAEVHHVEDVSDMEKFDKV